jgi:hypothetical protein
MQMVGMKGGRINSSTRSTGCRGGCHCASTLREILAQLAIDSRDCPLVARRHTPEIRINIFSPVFEAAMHE